MLQVFKHKDSKGATQLVPKFFSGTEGSSAFLVKLVGKFQNLMDIKCKQIDDEKCHG